MNRILFLFVISIPFFGFGQMDVEKTNYYNGKLKSEIILKDGKRMVSQDSITRMVS
jgi:hypothetical protein